MKKQKSIGENGDNQCSLSGSFSPCRLYAIFLSKSNIRHHFVLHTPHTVMNIYWSEFVADGWVYAWQGVCVWELASSPYLSNRQRRPLFKVIKLKTVSLPISIFLFHSSFCARLWIDNSYTTYVHKISNAIWANRYMVDAWSTHTHTHILRRGWN